MANQNSIPARICSICYFFARPVIERPGHCLIPLAWISFATNVLLKNCTDGTIAFCAEHICFYSTYLTLIILSECFFSFICRNRRKTGIITCMGRAFITGLIFGGTVQAMASKPNWPTILAMTAIGLGHFCIVVFSHTKEFGEFGEMENSCKVG